MPFDLLKQFNVSAAFRFVVAVDGTSVGAFTECTLPTIEWELEEVKEGGLNTYTHQLPGRRKSAKVSLKNGIGINKMMLDWYVQVLSEEYTRHSVTITMLNSLLIPILILHIEGAYPVKWTGPNLKSDDNTIAIQTLELACGEMTLVSL